MKEDPAMDIREVPNNPVLFTLNDQPLKLRFSPIEVALVELRGPEPVPPYRVAEVVAQALASVDELRRDLLDSLEELRLAANAQFDMAINEAKGWMHHE
jgi:hypothetical protein